MAMKEGKDENSISPASSSKAKRTPNHDERAKQKKQLLPEKSNEGGVPAYECASTTAEKAKQPIPSLFEQLKLAALPSIQQSVTNALETASSKSDKAPLLEINKAKKQPMSQKAANVTLIVDNTQKAPPDPVIDVFLTGSALEYENDVIIEKANISEARCTRVTFSKTQTVYECDAYQQRQLFKNPRSPADEWRTYGPLLKIHEIGGWIIDKKSTRRKKDPVYKFIAKGTAPPKPPSISPITTQQEFYERQNYNPESASK